MPYSMYECMYVVSVYIFEYNYYGTLTVLDRLQKD